MAGEGAPEVGPKESADKTKVQKKHGYLRAGCLKNWIENRRNLEVSDTLMMCWQPTDRRHGTYF